ncbi:MAG: hypothetical protein ABIN35_08605 [candidate division WOR-3 bacterium]
MKNKNFLIKISFLIIGILFFVVAMLIVRLGVLITQAVIFLGILMIIVGIVLGFREDRKKKRRVKKFFDVSGVDLLILGFVLFIVSVSLVNISFRKNPFNLIIYLTGYLGIFLIIFGIFRIVYRVIKKLKK